MASAEVRRPPEGRTTRSTGRADRHAGPVTSQGGHRAGTETPHVSKQYPQPPRPVEGSPSDLGALQQSRVPSAEVAARRVSELRNVRPASGVEQLTHPPMAKRSVAAETNGAAALEELQQIAGLPLSLALLERAVTHRSYAYENGGLPTNERLEFLGDAVLGLVITDTLYRRFPELPEGQLAKFRSAVVNMRALAEVARSLRLGEFLRLGRGEESTGGRNKSSILADALEALIGTVYVEHGLDGAAEFVHRLFDPLIDRAAALGAGLDWKTSLQELTAAQHLGVPFYDLSERGPDHEKVFTAEVRIGGRVYGTGSGHSKKEAEQRAAQEAWLRIRRSVDGADATS